MSAATGIDLTAPVIARHEIAIHAPLERVWDLHVDVSAWPSWNPDITDTTTETPLAAGVSFLWHTAGFSILSTVHAMTERGHILWGGTVAGITGIHLWRFTETPRGCGSRLKNLGAVSRVAAHVTVMHTGLDQSLVAWLRQLKAAAEATA